MSGPATATARLPAFLSPTCLHEWESRPEVAYLRYACGLGHLVPRPAFDGFAVGREVDAAIKASRAAPTRFSGVRLAPKRTRAREPEDVEAFAEGWRIAAGYSAVVGRDDDLRWDPTGDRVLYRVVELAGRRVPVGGIPDAVHRRRSPRAPWVPCDLKTTTSPDGALRTFTRAWGLEGPSRRRARGAAGNADWVIRRHPDWATAAVFYAWALNGWTPTVPASWRQVDGSAPGGSVVVRELRVVLPERFVRCVARRARDCWEALAAGAAALDPAYRNLPPTHLAVLVG